MCVRACGVCVCVCVYEFVCGTFASFPFCLNDVFSFGGVIFAFELEFVFNLFYWYRQSPIYIYTFPADNILVLFTMAYRSASASCSAKHQPLACTLGPHPTTTLQTPTTRCLLPTPTPLSSPPSAGACMTPWQPPTLML